MEDDEVWRLFNSLFDDMIGESGFPNTRPLLAHYTSMQVVESMLAHDEIWFSNPLVMNDFEEVRFGYMHGARLAKESSDVQEALRTSERHSRFTFALEYFISDFERTNLLDTYVFCLSEHSANDRDGLLSMWRGYGGNGRGAAVVIDTAKIQEVGESPLLILRVKYGSAEERLAWIEQKIAEFAEILTKNDIPDEQIHLAASQLHEVIKMIALTTKYHGFKEEREWRVVYLSDRDDEDKLKDMLS